MVVKSKKKDALSERQMQIIGSAGALLTRGGVHGLTIKNLAREMNFTEPALYRHFSSKEEIIIAMLRYLSDDMDRRLEKVMHSNKNFKEKFRTIFKEQFSYFKKNPHFLIAVFADGLMEESKSINEALNQIMVIKRKHLLRLLSDAQQKGELVSSVSAEEMTHIVMGTFRLHMYKWRMADFSFDLRKSGTHLIDSLLLLLLVTKK